MLVNDVIRVKSDGKSIIKLTVTRGSSVINANLEYHFEDEKPALVIKDNNTKDKVSEADRKSAIVKEVE